ncbi:MAG: hypothetical protein HPY66_0840 [Firmicutes bacterium]|nr:hypothetical protein [Bacillota bacterium]MDI6706510.1 hypothetical protein [Bacillota bacterium]
MSIRKSRFTDIKGHREEFAADIYKKEDRHFHREAKSQKTQLENGHGHGIRKDVKVPIKRKMT